MVMPFSATFNNISVISWWSVVHIGEGNRRNHWPVANHWQTLSHILLSHKSTSSWPAGIRTLNAPYDHDHRTTPAYAIQWPDLSTKVCRCYLLFNRTLSVDWLMFNVQWAIFQLYSGRRTLSVLHWPAMHSCGGWYLRNVKKKFLSYRRHDGDFLRD